MLIGITSPKNRKVGPFLRKMDSCFLIETKFISKLFKKFRRQNESQEIPHLRLFIISSYYRILKSKNQQKKRNTKVHKNTKNEKQKFIIRVPGYIAILFGWILELSKFRQNLDP